MPTISRRRFMAALAAAPLGLALDTDRVGIADAPSKRARPPKGRALDVAIVGAGISGLYAAWRLLSASRKQMRVKVFEGSDYSGGRLLSVVPPNVPDMVAELGGMRFQPSVHRRLLKLIQTVNGLIPNAQRIATYSFSLDRAENISYIRGTRLRFSELTASSPRIPYRLEGAEADKAPNDILVAAMEQVIPGITTPWLTFEQRLEMARNAQFDSTPLYQQGLWDVLSEILSWEAYRLCVDTLGFESILTNWNAADAIPWFLTDFGVDPQFRGFTHGFQQVPLTLAGLLEERGGEVECNKQLTGFDWSGDGFELNFDDESVTAKALILAMPRRSLELLAPGSPLLGRITDLIESVTPQPLLKVFLTYDSPWWSAAGTAVGGKFAPLLRGRSTTDLPLRQIFYWPQTDGEPATNGPAMLLASYNDGRSIEFWDGFEPLRDRFRRRISLNAESQIAMQQRARLPSSRWDKYPVDDRMLRELRRQLSQVHDLEEVPVTDAAFKDWEDDPFGGGWNAWNIGVQSKVVARRMVQPNPGLPLFICGEAYSDFQGWVEGALQTADMVLAKFGLHPL